MSCVFFARSLCCVPLDRNYSMLTMIGSSNTAIYIKKKPDNLRYRGHTQLPPDFGVNLFPKKPKPSPTDSIENDSTDSNEEEEEREEDGDDSRAVWDSDEIEAISSIFRVKTVQKPGGNFNRERPLPLPLPHKHKLRPRSPTPNRHVRLASPNVASSRASVSKQVHRSAPFLVGLAREISKLSPEEDASVVLDKCGRFLRKGSLSMTIRELGRMDLPARALQVFCWSKKQPLLYPDDLILNSVVEVLATSGDLEVPLDVKKVVGSASQDVVEAMVKGFSSGGTLRLAQKLLKVSEDDNKMLDPSIYVKLILKLAKNPAKHVFVVHLLNDIGEREDLNLNLEDCTSIMKVCIQLGKFDTVDRLFKWFTQKGNKPSLVMYTTLIHGRYRAKQHREALAVVWEMESVGCLFDLPAYRVVINVCFALNDLSRAVRYFSKLKEAGFSPPYDIYRKMIQLYMASGRLAKCKDICREAEISGFKLDKQLTSQLLQLERETRVQSVTDGMAKEV